MAVNYLRRNARKKKLGSQSFFGSNKNERSQSKGKEMVTHQKRKPKTPLTSIRTGSGDKGLTFLQQPGVSKASPIVDFVGTLDEACAALACCELGFDFGSSEEADLQLKVNQIFSEAIESFFVIGALVHSPSRLESNIWELDLVTQKMTTIINEVTANPDLVEPLEGFIIPNSENGDFMLARAVIRRAERLAVASDQMWAVPFLNTLSDFVFIIVWMSTHFYKVWRGLEDVTVKT